MAYLYICYAYNNFQGRFSSAPVWLLSLHIIWRGGGGGFCMYEVDLLFRFGRRDQGCLMVSWRTFRNIPHVRNSLIWKDLRCCYVTVESAMAASQNGFCSSKLSIQKNINIMQIMRKILHFLWIYFYHREVVKLDHLWHFSLVMQAPFCDAAVAKSTVL